MTALLARLERRGLIKRRPDPTTAERQVAELDQLDVPAIARLFDDLTRRLDDLHATFSGEELRIIARWLPVRPPPNAAVPAVAPAKSDLLPEPGPRP